MAEFVELSGNIFRSGCELLVVTVNCEGVMGAGIALDAKLRWPGVFQQYETECQSDSLRIGTNILIRENGNDVSRNVICFPTKDRWRNPSKISYIQAGLEDLKTKVKEHHIRSIAMPHLGCSNGGLQWSEVKPHIKTTLGDLPSLRVELWNFVEERDDPDFAKLITLLRDSDKSAATQQLRLQPRQFNSLVSALRLEGVRGLSSLQRAPGVGEKTLAAVYRFLFPTQSELRQPQQLGFDL